MADALRDGRPWRNLAFVFALTLHSSVLCVSHRVLLGPAHSHPQTWRVRIHQPTTNALLVRALPTDTCLTEASDTAALVFTVPSSSANGSTDVMPLMRINCTVMYGSCLRWAPLHGKFKQCTQTRNVSSSCLTYAIMLTLGLAVTHLLQVTVKRNFSFLQKFFWLFGHVLDLPRYVPTKASKVGEWALDVQPLTEVFAGNAGSSIFFCYTKAGTRFMVMYYLRAHAHLNLCGDDS